MLVAGVARPEGGRGTELDVARSRAQSNNTLASIPPLEADVARAIHRLGVFSGKEPAALSAELVQAAPLLAANGSRLKPAKAVPRESGFL